MTFDELAKEERELDFYGMENNYFKLDDEIYEAIEDENDGYRSYLEEIRPTTDAEADSKLIFFQNPVDRVKIVVTGEPNFDGYDIVVALLIQTGEEE